MVKRLRVASCGLVLTAVLITASCTPDDGTTQSTSPSPAMTASTTPTPTPTENAQERQQRLDQGAAESAYRMATNELGRLAMAGGASKPTRILVATTAGGYLDGQMGDQRYLKKHGLRADRPLRTSVVADSGWSATKIGLTACEDGSQVRLLNKSGKEVEKNRPRRLVQTLTATKVSGVWKITDLDATKAVETFESESACRP